MGQKRRGGGRAVGRYYSSNIERLLLEREEMISHRSVEVGSVGDMFSQETSFPTAVIQQSDVPIFYLK